MRELRRDNFGLLIAYLLPGSVALWGVSYHVEAVRPWLQAAPREAPSIGGFLYATLASTALGLVVSAVRWATVDRALASAGVRQPRWDFELFAERLPAYEWLVANHYRYYQFYANMLVALAGAYGARLFAATDAWQREIVLAAAFALTEGVLLAGARDTLGKYYTRTEALLARGRRKQARRTGAMSSLAVRHGPHPSPGERGAKRAPSPPIAPGHRVAEGDAGTPTPRPGPAGAGGGGEAEGETSEGCG